MEVELPEEEQGMTQVGHVQPQESATGNDTQEMLSLEGAAGGGEPFEDADDQCEWLTDFGGLDGRDLLESTRVERVRHREQDAFAPVFVMPPPEVCILVNLYICHMHR